MSITRWEPFGELVSLRQAMDRLFEDSFVRPGRLLGGVFEGTYPAVDLYETDGEVVVKATLPGVKPEDVDITVTGDTLQIKGEVKAEEEVRRENYLRQERRYGSFSRSVPLPGQLKTDKAEAVFENGVLTLTIPKAEEIRPKSIKIKSR